MAMKWIATAMMAVCLLAGGVAQAETGNISDVEISFMGIKFGTNYLEAYNIFINNGLKFMGEDKNGFPFYYGKIGREYAKVIPGIMDGNVEKIVVLFEPKKNANYEFEKKTQIVSKKYGERFCRLKSVEYNNDYYIDKNSDDIVLYDIYVDKIGNCLTICLDGRSVVRMYYQSLKFRNEMKKQEEKANNVF